MEKEKYCIVKGWRPGDMLFEGWSMEWEPLFIGAEKGEIVK